MLASKAQATWKEIPHEPGNQFELAALSWGQLKEAREEQRREAFGMMREAGAELMAAMPKPDQSDKIINAALSDELTEYSVPALLKYGVRNWQGPNYSGVEVSDAALAELDEVTTEWAAREILAASRIGKAEQGKSLASSARTTKE